MMIHFARVDAEGDSTDEFPRGDDVQEVRS